MSDNSKWYVFYVRSRAEKIAVSLLQEAGFEAYLPLMSVKRIWSDRIKTVIVPMFTGYVFVHCGLSEIDNVLDCQHLVAALKIGSEFSFVRQKEIDLLKSVEAGDYSVSVEPGLLNIGDNVEIVSGVLKGYIGSCIEESGANYFVVAIEGINQSIKIKIGREKIRRSTWSPEE